MCKIKNGTWVPNPNGGHGNKTGRKQQPQGASFSRPAVHAAETTPVPQGPSMPQPTHPPTSSNPLSALSVDQIQQLTHALSLLSSGNGNTYANAAGSNYFSIPSINSVFTKPWILDNSATNHIVFYSTLFTHTKPLSIPIVNLPTGSSIPITCTGTIPFNFDITLADVLCVPSFNLNLMSASKVTDFLNCCVILFPTFCVLQDLASGKMIGSGKMRGGLYYMSPIHQTPASYQVSHPSNLWHQRLGHPPPSHLKLASSLLLSNAISLDNHCSVCPLAKQTRLPFSLSSISTHASFVLLHCDI